MRKNGLYLRLSIADGDLGKDNKFSEWQKTGYRELSINYIPM